MEFPLSLPIGPKCDFCSYGTPIWEYPALDFVAAGVILDSTGKHVKSAEHLLDSESSWLACERCAQFLETKQFAELAHILTPRPELRQVAEAMIVLWTGFDEYRRGQRRRIPGTQ